MKKNVLVFGGTRYMGKHLVKELLAQDYAVTIATRGITKDDFGEDIIRLLVDRTSAESLRKNVPPIEYDIVFDSLAYCSNDIKHLLDVVRCRRYVQTSTVSVYRNLHNNTKEEEFDAAENPIIYCDRQDFPYPEVKQQAEKAIVQAYPEIPSVRVRFPFVVGMDDYTKRLYFYVEHIVNEKPMHVDNYDARMAFVRSDEAGKFLAFLGNSSFKGAINGASEQTISISEIAEYVKHKTGKTAVFSESGENAPYNGAEDYFLNVDKSKSLGFSFTPLLEWIYSLIDDYIEQARKAASES